MQTNRLITLLIGFILLPFCAGAQAGKVMNADMRTDTYQLIESFGYGVEVPDCGHPIKHITQRYDADLGRDVLVFTLHATLDDDRCGSTDRQRTEIKTYAPSPEDMKGFRGTTHTYRWKFKLDEGFQPSPNFCHIHQVKADSGPHAGAPIVTLTPRWKEDGEVLQLNVVSPENHSTILAEAPLDAFKGVWVQVSETILHDSPGFMKLEIRRVSDGALLLEGASEFDLWRDGAQFNRPKYGIYRSLNSPDFLRDESVCFADIEFIRLEDQASTEVPGATLHYPTGQAPEFWSIAAAQTTMARWPDYTKAYWQAWTYVNTYMACAFERLYEDTGDQTYLAYIKTYIDNFIDADGNFIPATNYKGVTRVPNYCDNLDGMMPGHSVVMLYEHTGEARYKKAAGQILDCLRNYPRNRDGGFWHNARMDGQMWIDGIFMGQMFLLRYGRVIGESHYAYDEAVKQIVAYSKTGEQGNSGLYVHGVYEPGHGPRECAWADPATGKSPEVWGEGLGWYALVLAEALGTIPADHPGYDEVKNIFIRMAQGLKRNQDPVSGGWYQVVDRPDRADNWIETSGSAMFTYALQEGVNLGILAAAEYEPVVKNGYRSITAHARINGRGLVDVYEACDGVGVQSDYEKYIHYKRSINAKEAFVGFVWATEIVEREAIKKSRR